MMRPRRPDVPADEGGRRGRGRHLRPAPPAAGRHRRRHEPEPEPRGRSRRDRRQASAAPRIDPRIAARRAEVQAAAAEAASRRRRRVAGFTIVVIVLAASGAAALLSPLTGVQDIQVVGATRTPVAEVRTASGLEDGPPMIRVDERRARAAIASLPWVLDVRLERRWPRTVVVTVRERAPAAVAPCEARGASSCLIDAAGRVLAPVSADPGAATLLRLEGVPAAGPPGTTVADAVRGPLAVAVAMPEALRPLVIAVRGDGDAGGTGEPAGSGGKRQPAGSGGTSEVALHLQAPGRAATPPVVRLGEPHRIPEKLTAAATVLARTSVNGVAVLDVRVPESPALTRVRR